jgi:cephalosporin-C deacetylase-like acetyl esterase
MLRAALVLGAAAVCLRAQDDGGLLGWMDRIAQSELDARAAAISGIHTVADAERRHQEARAKILEAIGGLPGYQGPLNAQVTGRLDHAAYVIEKVAFETLPKVWVTANLYRPNAPGRRPGILLPLGHQENGKPVVQVLAANLALKGFVVLAYDPYGQGERLQAWDRRLGRSLAGGATAQHNMAGAQALLAGQSFARYRIWDAKRALDYLVSRPEVDPDRIGATGCSGGGTLTTFISALDPRIKVAAPACYMNSFRVLFSGPVGDAEQSPPGFLSSGLDQADFVELFAPKPWLIASTIEDFFKLEGARQVYEEAQRWYRLYGQEDRIAWTIGHGGHGTPLEVREAIYGWMIRWLAGGRGEAAEQPVELHADYELQVTKTGQVSTDLGSRDVYEVIRDDFERLRRPGTQAEMLADLRQRSPEPPAGAPEFRTVEETRTAGLVTRRIAFETEPGLELRGALLAPRAPGPKPGVLVVETEEAPSPAAVEAARAGAVVLSLLVRGEPEKADWLPNTRAALIGRSLQGLRAYDIRRGLSLLAAQPDVDPARLRAAARGVAGTWLLVAAALDGRISGLWLDRTPHDLRSALDNPLHRGLYDAVLPGFLLHWDLPDLVRAIEPRRLLWTDPTDWIGGVVVLGPKYLYRPFEAPDRRYIEALLQ